MLQPPRNSHFEYQYIGKKTFLEGVLTRLINDVGTYFDNVILNDKTGVGVGFWGSVRLIMPVIEAVSYIYPNYQSKPWKFMDNELRVGSPELIWILFRHSLVHNDLLQHGQYEDKTANWGVSFFGLNHIIGSGHLGLDTLKLYNDLKVFLEKEVAETDDSEQVTIISGIVWDKPSQEIIDEFEYIARPQFAVDSDGSATMRPDA